MSRIKEVLLVDDSRGTNALNARLLMDMGVALHVSTALNGKVALDYLTTKNQEGYYPRPELILLDINMPVMNGYQFLDEYVKLDERVKSKMSIFMLTTSTSEVDIRNSEQESSVQGYHSKPLTRKNVEEVMNALQMGE